MHILVTAIGSPLGQSVAKAGELAGFKVLGGDSSRHSASLNGRFKTLVLPSCDEASYASTLKALLLEHDIDFYIPCFRKEIDFYFENLAFFERLNVKVGVINQGTYSVLSHKLACNQYLAALDVPVPLTCTLDEQPAFDGPWVVKPIYGASSNGIHFVDSRGKLDLLRQYLAPDSETYIIQRDLGRNLPEYTSGVFKVHDQVLSIHMRRELKFGLSYKTELVRSPILDSYCLKIASSFDFTGAINVQSKIVDGQPYCFEINPRFSSTTCIRARLGFNEVALFWQALNKRAIDLPKVESYRCYRYWEEEYHDQ